MIWTRVLIDVVRGIAYIQLEDGKRKTIIRTVRTSGVYERVQRLVKEINRRTAKRA